MDNEQLLKVLTSQSKSPFSRLQGGELERRDGIHPQLYVRGLRMLLTGQVGVRPFLNLLKIFCHGYLPHTSTLLITPP